MCTCLHSLQLHLLGFDMWDMLTVHSGCLFALGVQPEKLLTMLLFESHVAHIYTAEC